MVALAVPPSGIRKHGQGLEAGQLTAVAVADDDFALLVGQRGVADQRGVMAGRLAVVALLHDLAGQFGEGCPSHAHTDYGLAFRPGQVASSSDKIFCAVARRFRGTSLHSLLVNVLPTRDWPPSF